MMGSKDKKLKAGSSSSKPLSSCVAKGHPTCSPEQKQTKQQACVLQLDREPHVKNAFGLALLPPVEVGQQVAGAALQVRAGEVAVQVGHELVEAVVARRGPEVLVVLVQPGAQDGGDVVLGDSMCRDGRDVL
ncbi:hypothetical protein EYF80_037376 [Liparis tanakae]|uniref:Uncharacterized protein n=1 Tax=Liparis tanakae TaxID=230148 RepID=A0A4Z2GG24_9TELE|nr:hypothetical protein EYF80_037376 [Liparis tanakae]